MKILVTGATGMLGREVVKQAEVQYDVDARSHSDLDIQDIEIFRKIIIAVKPDIVINCAGIVKGREDVEAQEVVNINAKAPIKMAMECEKLNIRMIQISTDHVFRGDGIKNERDLPNATDNYGKSKAEGELIGDGHLTIRCSFIGLGKRGLLNWLMHEEGDIFGYRNVQWNGLTVNYAVKQILQLALTDLEGIIHIFGRDTNKYKLLVAANNVFGLKKNIIPVNKPVADFRLRTVMPFMLAVPVIEEQLKELAVGII